MNLQTMMLPTGEFILVVSGVKHSQNFVDTNEFRKASGIAGILLLEDDYVDVDNALFDENAKRV